MLLWREARELVYHPRVDAHTKLFDKQQCRARGGPIVQGTGNSGIEFCFENFIFPMTVVAGLLLCLR